MDLKSRPSLLIDASITTIVDRRRRISCCRTCWRLPPFCSPTRPVIVGRLVSIVALTFVDCVKPEYWYVLSSISNCLMADHDIQHICIIAKISLTIPYCYSFSNDNPLQSIVICFRSYFTTKFTVYDRTIYNHCDSFMTS